MTRAAVNVREGYVEVTAGRVWYRVVGGGKATPLVTVHGGPGGMHDYLEPLGVLADERPVPVQARGIGCAGAGSANGRVAMAKAAAPSGIRCIRECYARRIRMAKRRGATSGGNALDKIALPTVGQRAALLCATFGGALAAAVGVPRVIIPSSRSRSCSNPVSTGPSSTRPRYWMTIPTSSERWSAAPARRRR